MKTIARLMAVAVLFVAAEAFAAGIDGNYSFNSRVKEGTPDLVGWTGTMTISSTTMSRKYVSKDGKEEKFYDATLKNDGGDVYTCKFTKAYKPEYVGQEHKNKIALTGSQLVMESTDGKFKEIWTKK